MMTSSTVGRRSGEPGRVIRPTIFHHSAGALVLVDGRCLIVRRAGTTEWVLPTSTC